MCDWRYAQPQPQQQDSKPRISRLGFSGGKFCSDESESAYIGLLPMTQLAFPGFIWSSLWAVSRSLETSHCQGIYSPRLTPLDGCHGTAMISLAVAMLQPGLTAICLTGLMLYRRAPPARPHATGPTFTNLGQSRNYRLRDDFYPPTSSSPNGFI
jgi:hypothetical protein